MTARHTLACPALAAALLLVAPACAGDDAAITLSLSDGAIVGGDEETAIIIDREVDVVRAELLLDGQPVATATAEMAPYVARWSTLAIAEGPHELRAVVELAGGDRLSVTVGVIVDNTAPTVELPQQATVGELVRIVASDAHGVQAVAVTLDGLPVEIVGGAALWSTTCGPIVAAVTATDRAGWSTTVTGPVPTLDPDDQDCDGARLEADCDDLDAAMHPGARDADPAVDANCDGVLGNDRDGDGVVTAIDCDDDDAATYPAELEWVETPLDVTWEPGDAAITVAPGDDGTPWLWLTNPQGENLEVHAYGVDGSSRSTWYWSSVVVRDLAMATVDGQAFLVMARGAFVFAGPSIYDEVAVLSASRPIDDVVAVAGDLPGQVHVVARAGTELWYAVRNDDTWTSTMIAADPALAPIAPGLASFGGVGFVGFVVDGVLHEVAVVDGELEPRTPTEVGAVDHVVAYGNGWLVGAGFTLSLAELGQVQEVRTFPGEIDRLVVVDRAIAVQHAARAGTQLLITERLDTPWTPVDAVLDMAARRPDGTWAIVAPEVLVHQRVVRPAPLDPFDDIDQDCDGIDG